MKNRKSSSDILIVDDKPENLRLLSVILKKQGYTVRTLKNGRMVQESVIKYPPDIILLDIMMPEMDGYEVCALLKADQQTRDIPVIFVSALDQVTNKVKGFSMGGVDYVTKPFQAEEVLARVKTHLHIRRLQHHTEKQAATLKAKNRKLKKLKAVADRARRKIMDSVSYAEMIQRSILPNTRQVKTFLPESFFLWMPRDIVSGDIFFADTCAQGCVIAVIDCTGHGIPGAFMTMIASSGLRRIIKDEGCHDPPEILKQLNFFVKTTLQQDQPYAVSDDGLDAAICLLEIRDGQELSCDSHSLSPLTPDRIIFAGAKLPLFYVQDGQINIIRGDRQSIGYKRSDLNFSFTRHIVPVREATSFYMATDGYPDQMTRDETARFGCRRLGKKLFAKLLREISDLPFEIQKERLIEKFNEHQGDMPRQDDVTVTGFGF